MAVIPLSPVTQKPPEGDENDVPPIRIMTNQTIEKGSRVPAIFEHVHSYFFSKVS